FTEEGNYPFLISKEYVEAKKVEWGEDNPLYEVYVKGDFPSGETDRLIPFGLAELAINRTIKVAKEETLAIGVDTARFGGDESALYIRHGGKVIRSSFWKKCDTEATIGRIVHEIGWVRDKYEQVPTVSIDEGYNPGVVDALKGMNYRINAVSFQGKAKDSKVFANVRAEMYWNLADLFKTGEIDIPNDKTLLKQVTDIKKKPLNRNDQIIIESKDDMKARGLKSPDRADALALCFMNPVHRTPTVRWL
ncbi:hypothetical protein LCGC14_3144390, partial [marine sediment metagenome]